MDERPVPLGRAFADGEHHVAAPGPRRFPIRVPPASAKANSRLAVVRRADLPERFV